MTVYIPTIGYAIGRPESNVDKIIKYASNARRKCDPQKDKALIDYYNDILSEAYEEKYKNL